MRSLTLNCCRGRLLVGSSWRFPKRILNHALLVAAGAALSGCGQLPQNVFDPKGTVAEMQLDLLNYTMWFAIIIGAVVAVGLLYVVMKFRDKGTANQPVPKQIHGSTKLEILWTVIPILILVSVAVPTVTTGFASYEPAAKDNAITITATGHQWWFQFDYPEHNFTTGNEMVIPVGKPIVVMLESNDVIHSFWVPKLAGKVDLVPGRTNKMWLDATEPGIYYGQCAEYCGSAHANMRFRVKAVSQAEYDQWVSDRKAGAVKPTDAQAIKGQAVFEKTCAACHAIDGTKAQGKVGPNLSNIGARSTLAAGMVENTEENLRLWVRNPKNFKPTDKMPNHESMPDADFDALIKYLRSLNK